MTLLAAFNLAVGHHQAGRLNQAEAIYNEILRQDPTVYEARRNLGLLMQARGDAEKTIACFRAAVALRGDSADAHNNLGQALYCRGDIEAAIDCFAKAVERDATVPGYLINLANVYQKTAQWPAAIDCCRRAIALDAQFAAAHWNLGILLLSQGDFENGWPEFEWRWQVAELDHPRLAFSQPFWDGGDLRGRRLLLHADYGAGDAIQFIRYLPRIAERGGRVILAAQPELLPLLGQLPGIDEAVAAHQPLPAFDVHMPLLSLHRALPIRLDNIPTAAYLPADTKRTADFAARIPRDGVHRIGLVWANKPNPPDRSPPPQELAPLASVAGVRFFSLQKWRADMARSAPPLEMTDWTHELHDFADTAALIQNLDLVITVDTAVAHLAGAMGTKVWLLLKFAPDWRWMTGRADSPWYPTMRLFRQSKRGDWTDPIARLVQALRKELEP